MPRLIGLAALFLLIAVAAPAQQPGLPPRVSQRGGVEQPGPPPRVSQRGGVEQPVQLQFQDGRVTLRAQNAPVRAILAEWARLGGATIVNGDRVTGPPLTLELTGVPERQALDIVLRSVAGYMLAPRRAAAAGASAFDRIMILPTSVAPRNPPPAPAAAARPTPVFPRPPVVVRPPAPVPAATPAPEAALVEEPADLVQGDEASTEAPLLPGQVPPPGLPQPRALPQPLVRPAVMPPAGGAGPELVPEQPEPEVAQPGTQPAVAPRAGNPFGIPAGSSTTPGVIAPVPRPQPQQPQQ